MKKNEERLGISRFLLYLLIYLRALFCLGIKSHEIQHTFKMYD